MLNHEGIGCIHIFGIELEQACTRGLRRRMFSPANIFQCIPLFQFNTENTNSLLGDMNNATNLIINHGPDAQIPANIS